MKETHTENDENENKNNIKKMDYGKAIEKSARHEDGSNRLGVGVGAGGSLPLQRNVYPLTPFLSAPLLTNYDTIDPLAESGLWPSLVPVVPTGLSPTIEVTKTETSSTYTFFRPDELAESVQFNKWKMAGRRCT